ncbi:MAG: META domain-containing protein [Clostridiales bacterium]|nr:META domain-containing protein [Clostridiales bacterium]
MKKIFFSTILIAVLMLCAGCAGLKGKEWKLTEVRAGDKETVFDRKALSEEEASDIFTMLIEDELISGVGAVNRFSAPCVIGKKEIKIQPMRTTMMAPLRQPEKLKEHEFFIYLQNTTEWKVVDKKLEFHSKTDDGTPVVLVFAL